MKAIKEGSAEKFVTAIIRNGHESVIEHVSFTVKFIVDRGGKGGEAIA